MTVFDLRLNELNGFQLVIFNFNFVNDKNKHVDITVTFQQFNKSTLYRVTYKMLPFQKAILK